MDGCNYPIHRLKHDIFSLLFKVKSSLELVSGKDDLLSIARENILSLEKVLRRVMLLSRLAQGDYSFREEETDICLLIGEILGTSFEEGAIIKTDSSLLTEAFYSLKDILGENYNLSCSKDGFSLEGELNIQSEVERFYLEFFLCVLSCLGMKVKHTGSKIEVRWQGCS